MLVESKVPPTFVSAAKDSLGERDLALRSIEAQIELLGHAQHHGGVLTPVHCEKRTGETKNIQLFIDGEEVFHSLGRVTLLCKTVDPIPP